MTPQEPKDSVLWKWSTNGGLITATTFEDEGATWLNVRLCPKKVIVPTPTGVIIPSKAISNLAKALAAYSSALRSTSVARGLAGSLGSQRDWPLQSEPTPGTRRIPWALAIVVWELATPDGVVRAVETEFGNKHKFELRLWVDNGRTFTRVGVEMPCKAVKGLARALTAYCEALPSSGP